MPGSAIKSDNDESDTEFLDDETLCDEDNENELREQQDDDDEVSDIDEPKQDSSQSVEEDLSHLNLKEPPSPSHLFFSPKKISTPKRLRLSLGCNQNTSDLSFSSAMETPKTPKTTKTTSPTEASDGDKTLSATKNESGNTNSSRPKCGRRRRQVAFEPSTNLDILDVTLTSCDQSTSPIITSSSTRQLHTPRSPRRLFDKEHANAESFVSPQFNNALTFLFNTPPTSEDAKNRRKSVKNKPRKKLTDDDVLSSLISGTKCADETKKENLCSSGLNLPGTSSMCFERTLNEEELMDYEIPLSPIISSTQNERYDEEICDNLYADVSYSAKSRAQNEVSDDNSLSATFPSDFAEVVETAVKLAESTISDTATPVVYGLEGGIKRTNCDGVSSENSKKIKTQSDLTEEYLASESIFSESFTQTQSDNLCALDSKTSCSSNLGQSANDAAISPITVENTFNQTKFAGFSTAAGRGIAVSKEAVSKAKQLLDENNLPEIKDGGKQNVETSFSFSTAGGKSNKVSSDALKKARTTFLEETLNQTSSANTGFVGFSTAAGKNINVSAEAVMKAKDLFLGCDTGSDVEEHDNSVVLKCDHTNNPTSDDDSWPDEEIIARSECVESKVEQTEQEEKSERKSTSDSTGFATAAGEKIPVSEESLPKEKEEMDNVPLNDQPTEPTPDNFDTQAEVAHLTEAFLKSEEVIAQDVIDTHLTHPRIVVKKFPVHALREKARNVQESKIAEKRNRHIRAFEGELYRQKTLNTGNRKSLREYVGRKCPGRYTTEQLRIYGVKVGIMNVNAETAEDYRFDAREYLSSFDDSISVEFQTENGPIVLDNSGFVGKSEIYRALVADSSVDEKLISVEWVFNHYRWIVWKLAAMEMSFPESFANRCLTVEHVMLQLKYRYDREIDKGQRSALKKIMERDDTPAKTMVFCIYRIIRLENSDFCVEATDGWYKIGLEIDGYLKHLIRTNKIFVGQKIVTHNAELVGSIEACSPLEAPPNLKLKISGNSTRIARWDMKLGYFCNPRPFAVALSSISPDGGVVSCTQAVIARIYPIQFMERIGDRYIFRDELAESKAAAFHEKFCLNLQEKLMAKLLDRMQTDICGDKRKLQVKSPQFKDIRMMHTGEELFEIFDKTDIENADISLSLSQMNLLSEFRNKVLDKKRELFERKLLLSINEEKEAGRFPDDRVVVPFIRILLAGISSSTDDKCRTVIFTIWRPIDEVNSLREGDSVRLYYINATRRGNRFGDIQLSSTRQTKFEKFILNTQIHFTAYAPRKVPSFSELNENNFIAHYNQVDIVGFAIRISDRNRQRGGCKIVYLTDDFANIIGIRFWNGLACFASQDRIKIGQFVAGMNLEKNANNSSNSVCYLNAIETSVFTQLPKLPHLKTAMEKLTSRITNPASLLDEATEKLNRLSTDEINPKVFDVLPVSSKVQEQSEHCKRKISRLMGLGVPPPLNPLVTPTSKSTRRGFKSPFKKS